MISILAGAFVAVLTAHFTGFRWLLLPGFWTIALCLQMAYAKRLNGLLGGADPVVALGAKNLSELKMFVPVPASISLMNFTARSCWWAGITAIGIGSNLLRVE